MRLTFLGAAGTVTGSRFLLASDSTRVLVDCGLFHGLKIHRRRNWEPLPFNPRTLDAIVLTHAHLDHSGYLPVLVNEGFAKPIYCTPPTRDLCRILLPDAGRIQEEDTRYANRKGFSRHRPALPLYTEKAALRAARKLCAFGSASELAIGNLRFSWRPSGHILGAASLHVHNGAGSILFSGDLGRFDKTLMLPPSEPGSPDWVVSGPPPSAAGSCSCPPSRSDAPSSCSTAWSRSSPAGWPSGCRCTSTARWRRT